MPLKHQTESYRVVDGYKMICLADVCDTAQGDLRAQAKALAAAHRKLGKKAMIEKQDGFYRVFGSP